MTDIVCISPVDGRELVRRAPSSDADVAQGVGHARAAQREWARTPVAERAQCMRVAVQAMLAMEREITPELALQMGRPVRYGASELRGFAERAHYMIGIAEEALADIAPPPKEGFRRSIRREPLGIVLTIAPWNYPYLTAVNSVVPALMAGNVVLLKHATNTTRCALEIERLFNEAGAPEGCFGTLLIPGKEMSKIVADPRIAAVTLTGSEDAGVSVARAAGENLKKCVLELGGSDAFVVLADADLEGCGLAAQALRHQPHRRTLGAEREGVLLEKGIEYVALVHAERTQDDRDRKLAPPVDARKHAVLRIEFEVEPVTTVGDDAR